MNKNSGYIALTSAIIISVILMAIVFTTSATGFRSRANIFDSSSKLASTYLAEACFESALIKLAEDSTYLGNETLNIESGECNILTIESVAETPPAKIIKTNSTVLKTNTSLKVKVNAEDLTIISWEEEAI